MIRVTFLKKSRWYISAIFSILLAVNSFAQDSITITRVFNHVYAGSITWESSLRGNYLDVHYYPGGIQTWNVSNPENPIVTNTLTPHCGEVVDLGNNYAFMAGAGSGSDFGHCTVLNTTNPAIPTVVTTFTVPFAHTILLVDSIVYIADYYNGMHIYSLANPPEPRWVRDINSGGFSSLATEGNRLYVGHTQGGISIYNIDNRELPVLIGSIQGVGVSQSLKVRDGIVYSACESAGLYVYNAVDLNNIRLLNQWSSNGNGASSVGLVLDENHLFVANSWDGLWVFDVSNPQSFIPISRYPNCVPLHLRKQGNYLYSSEYRNGFSIYRIDVFDPPPPPPAGDTLVFARVFNQAPPQAITWGVSLIEDVLYVGGSNGLQTWRTLTPSNLSLIATLPFLSSEVARISENFAMVLGGSNSQILNISDAEHPVVVNTLTLPYVDQIVALDTIVYIADRYVGIHVYSITNPSTPTHIRDVPSGGISSIAIEGNRLYAGQTSGGLSVYDITTRSNPVLIGSIAGTSTARRLVVRDGIVFVANFNAGVTVYNANNSESIQVINHWQGFTSGNSCDVLLSGNRLIVANGTDGLWAFDVSNPSAFSQIGRLRSCSPIVLRLQDNYLYTAEYSSGFSVYRIDTTATIPQTSFELTHPNGGERLVLNSLDTIRWNTNNNYSAVMIKINYNYPNGDWITIDGSSPNDGQEVWMVTGPTTNRARVKICAVVAPDTMDISESDFEIATSGLMDVSENLPIRSSLARVYPNPFNQTTSINFSLTNAENVRVDMFNLRGQLVESLLSERLNAGEHTVKWFADKHASGTYLYRLQAGKQVLTDRIVLLK